MFRRNVLIFHQGALGDFVMTWPIALAAGRLLAQSRVIYVTNSQKGLLAERALRLESTDVEAGWHQLFAELPQLPDRAKKILDGAQLILSCVASATDLWALNVARFAPSAQIICLQSKPPEDSAVHVTQHLVGQLAAFPPLQDATAQIIRSIGQRGISGVRENANGPVVIHPGSGAERKCWPADRFVELAEKLREAGKSVQFVLGEVEREQWPADRFKQVRSIAEVIEPASYVALFDVIRRASVFIGNDTGPTHLAGMCGVQTVALFGTDPTRWSPIGPGVRIVRGESIDSITVDEVVDALALFR